MSDAAVAALALSLLVLLCVAGYVFGVDSGDGADWRPTTPQGRPRALTSGSIARMIGFTEWASEILQRSHEAARRFNPNVTVRMSRRDGRVAFDLVEEAQPGDELVAGDGFELLAEPGLEGVVDVVEPHDQLILRPPGSTERSVREHH